jgi:hypothetical protein
MQKFPKQLLFLLFVLIALPSFYPVQLRELGTGTPGSAKAQHLIAQLIQGSRCMGPHAGARLATYVIISGAGRTASRVLPELMACGVVSM